MDRRGSRRRVRGMIVGAIVAIASVALVPLSGAQDGAWEIVHLQPLEGDQVSVVLDVNDDGIAVGSSGSGSDTTPVVWASDGTPTALPETTAGGRGQATAISDDGTIVGNVIEADVVGVSGSTAVLWTLDGDDYGLDVLGTGMVWDVNDDGVMVGAIPAVPVAAPALFRVGQDPAPLPTASGQGEAVRVNAANVVVGSDSLDPVAWSFGTRYLLYAVLEGHDVQVKDVTDSFYTLGWLTTGDRILSFVQAPGGAIFPLAPKTHSSAAADLNSIGLGAGRAGEAEGATFAALFVWGTTVPIESLLAPDDQATWSSLQDATAVNDQAWVVGSGTIGDSTAPQAWMVRPPQ